MTKKIEIIFRVLIFAILMPITSLADDPVSPDTKYLNIVEQLQNESDFIIASYDDWGIQGYFSNYGLPGYQIAINYNGFPATDPLYGTPPLSWLNSRLQKIKLSTIGPMIELAPVFADSGKNYSRFDYYRGDYGFNNFGLIVSGNLTEEIDWRFMGENLAYDGGYGLYGPDMSKLSESITQNYFLDFRKHNDNWITDLGTSYQKFTPGLMTPISQGIANGLDYLSWKHGGRLKEFRTNFYVCRTHSKVNRIFSIGAQLTNYYYSVLDDPVLYSFTADGFQLSGILKIEKIHPNGSLSYSATPIIEKIYVRRDAQEGHKLFRHSVNYIKQADRFDYTINLGSVNLNPVIKLSGALSVSDRLRISISSDQNYTAYPLGFFTEIGGIQQNRPGKAGFSYSMQSLISKYSFKESYIQAKINHAYSSLYVPHISSLSDTMASFNKKTLNSVYLTGEFDFRLPWRMSIKSRAVFLPVALDEPSITFQGWSHLYQEIDLFKNNLHLYASGDITYQTGPNTVIWFDQLRTVGTSAQGYYTNKQLTFGGTIGAHIGSFHIFYTVYNGEGRLFSSLPGMLYRNRLKIFGVDWTFIN